MATEHVETVRAVFEKAVALPHDSRAVFLAGECVDQPELLDSLRGLIEADARTDHFLDRGPEGLLALIEPWGQTQESPPPTVDPYRILRLLGEGGMGAVYLAERADGSFNRKVALKVVRGGLDSAEVLARFRAEQQILASLEHPNVARMYDAGLAADGRPFLVMEHVEGATIDRYCDEKTLDLEARIRLFLQVCDAVEHAHRALVIHRDLKPSNILVGRDGVVKLLDFGIARLTTPVEPEHRTRTGFRPMTPAYAAPEQIRGEVLTTAADIFALGVILHELLTGRRPIEDEHEILSRALAKGPTEPPRLPSARVEDTKDGTVTAKRRTTPAALRRALRGDLDWILLKALREAAEERYGSATALADDLHRYLSGRPVSARAGSRWYRFRKFALRHQTAVAAGVLVGLSVVAGIGTTLLQSRAAAQQRDTAEAVSSFLEDLFRGSDPMIREVADTTRLVDFLEVAVSRTRAELDGEPRVKSRLLQTLGVVHRNLSRSDLAIPILRDALEANAVGYPRANEEGVETARLLGLSLAETGAVDDGVRILETALADSRTLDPRGVQVPRLEATIGEAYLRVRRHEEAEPMLLAALRSRRAQDPPDSVQLATALNLLGSSYAQQSRYEEAVALLSEAADVISTYAGDPGGVNEGVIRANLSTILKSLTRFDEAEDQIRRALGLIAPSSGGPTLAKAKATVRLAETISARLQREEDTTGIWEADSLYREGIEMLEQLPPTPVGLTFELSSYAKSLRSWGRLEEAEVAASTALEAATAGLGATHLITLSITSDLGRIQAELGNVDEALALTSRALSGVRSTVSSDHPAALNAVLNHGRVLFHAGRGTEALELLEPARAVARAALPPNHPMLQTFDELIASARG